VSDSKKKAAYRVINQLIKEGLIVEARTHEEARKNYDLAARLVAAAEPPTEDKK